MSVYVLIGLVGVAFYLGSYAALQLGYISGRGYLYPFCNLMGAVCVGLSVLVDWNVSTLLISVTYGVISVAGLARTFAVNRNVRLHSDELRLIETILPGVDKSDARKLLEIGRWVDGKDRIVLTQEGLPISDLIWLHSGKVSVQVRGRHVDEMGAGAVLGEATCLNGAPATATVLVDGSARFFAVPVAKLRALVKSNGEIRACLQDAITHHMRDKLRASNRRLVADQASG
ncbi:MAG: cyclic nucleotide-binding domain-containing protein [Pseudomonadota bacterium]